MPSSALETCNNEVLMECPNCEQDFDPSVRSPRILPHCGHSLCHPCLKALWRQRQILCPQCGKSSSADTSESFPVNHSLLQMQSRASLNVFQCSKHGKALEAFCTLDKDLLCVVCLLAEEHKNHEVVAVNKAASQERESLSNLAIKVVQLEQEAAAAEARVGRAGAALKEELERTKESLGKVFDLVREVVQQRQVEMNSKLEADYADTVSGFAARLEDIHKQQFLLQALKAEISKTEDESDFELLLKSRDREIVSKAALSPLKPLAPCKALASSSREGELNTIWRQVREKFLHNGTHSPLRQPVPVSILSLDTGKETGRTGLTASADETAFKRLKKGERRLSPAPSIGGKASVLKVTVRKPNSPVPVKAQKPRTGVGGAKPRKSAGFSTPKVVKTPSRSDFGEEMDETPIHTHIVDLSSYLRRPSAFIYVFGGFSDSASAILRYDCRGDIWETLKAQCSRTLCGGVEWGEGAVLLLGGKLAGKRVGTSEVFRAAGESIGTGPVALRTVRSGFSCLRRNSSLFLLGGSDGVPLKSAEYWDEVWHDLPSMTHRRDELAAVQTSDGCIYALGGYGGLDMTCQASCERLEADHKTWTVLASMKTQRRALAAVALSTSIIAIGGYDGAKYLNSVERYDFTTGQWAFLRPMHQSRCALSAVLSPDQKFIYAVGGFNGTALGEVERYSVIEDEWVRVADLPMKRFMHIAMLLPYASAV